MSTISDTIRTSRKVIEHFRSSDDFDYYSQKASPAVVRSGNGDVDYSEWDPLNLPDVSGGIPSSLAWIIVVLLLLTIAAVVFYILYKKGVFEKKRKKEEEEKDEMEPENELAIDGHDLPDELEAACLARDWKACVRLVYLKSLKHLCDSGKLTWNAEKTPVDYSLEARILPFSQLTNLFMRVRYGLYEVSSDDYAEAESLAEQVAELNSSEVQESISGTPSISFAVGDGNTSPSNEKGGER